MNTNGRPRQGAAIRRPLLTPGERSGELNTSGGQRTLWGSRWNDDRAYHTKINTTKDEKRATKWRPNSHSISLAEKYLKQI